MRVFTVTPHLRNHCKLPISRLQPRRSFQLPSLSAFGSSASGPPPRMLSANRTLPFPPRPLFRTISAVEEYGDFLPFLTSSTVTARDPATGYPTRAYLTVGYGPLSETFLSKVECSEQNLTVGARSGERALRGEDGAARNGQEIFEYLDTIWKLEPVEGRAAGEELTKVELSVNFKFRSATHAAMMGAVEGQVAGAMIEAFEERVRAAQDAR